MTKLTLPLRERIENTIRFLAVDAVQRELRGVDASIVFSARMAGFNLGLKLLRRGGLFVAVGLPATSEGNLELNPFEFFLKDPTLIYSAVGNVQDMRELVDMVAAGQVKSHIGRTGALSELDAIFDELVPRLRNPELAGPVRRLRSNFINGVKEMRVRFDTEAR